MKNTVKLFIIAGLVTTIFACSKKSDSGSENTQLSSCTEAQLSAFDDTKLSLDNKFESDYTLAVADSKCRKNSKLFARDCKLDCTTAEATTDALCAKADTEKADLTIHLTDVYRNCGN